jgi:hypothetical protein
MDRRLEALKARLRSLPKAPVPAGLEARLLAAIPTQKRIRKKHLPVVWIGALAAACFLAVFARLVRERHKPASGPSPNQVVQDIKGSSANNCDTMARWQLARRIVEGEDPPPFTWPLQKMSPTRVPNSIRFDLLD